MQGGGGGGGKSNKAEQVMKTCESVLDKLPEPLDYEEVQERNESDASPLKVCLMQETERYNDLLKAIQGSVKLLQRGIQGLVVITTEQEGVMNSLHAGLVPLPWLVAYPSLKPLSSWLPDLQDRIEQMNTWAFVGYPKVFWIGGITYPTSMLTAYLQASARKNQISVDTLNFDFVVQNTDEASIQQYPKEGSYIKNMVLEGARWDPNKGELADAETMMLFSPFPIIHFKVISKKRTNYDGIYQCPLYLYPIRTGSRERPSFMIWVDLKSGSVHPDFWIKRGTALLLSVA